MTDDPARVRQTPEKLALLGIVVNALLAAGKLTAGVVGHSFALVADAVESLVDIAGSVVVWSAMRYGSKPADEEHPFGHGKIEPMAALAVASVIVLVGIGVAVEAVRQIITPHSMPRPWTLLVLVVVIVVKESLAWRTKPPGGPRARPGRQTPGTTGQMRSPRLLRSWASG